MPFLIRAFRADLWLLSNVSKMPGRTRVAPLANSEIITAKRALAVMASHTALSPSRGVMV